MVSAPAIAFTLAIAFTRLIHGTAAINVADGVALLTIPVVQAERAIPEKRG